MADAALKYLDFLQATIARMAGHSFTVKGWSITVTTAVLAIGYKAGDKAVLVVGLLPVLLFWVLDGYFLTLERRFRQLFRQAATPFAPDQIPTFDMSAGPLSLGVIVGVMVRPSLAFVHASLLAALVVARLI